MKTTWKIILDNMKEGSDKKETEWYSKKEIKKVIDNNKITSCGQDRHQVEQTRRINNILETIKRELFGA